MDKISELFLICLSSILLLKICLKCVNVTVFQMLLGDVKGLIVVCFMPYNGGTKREIYPLQQDKVSNTIYHTHISIWQAGKFLPIEGKF